MKSPWIIASIGLVSCTSTGAPRPPVETAVLIPKPTVVIPEDKTNDPPESSKPAKPRVQIVIGDDTVCLRFDGSLRCWGRTTSVQAPILMNVPAISGLDGVEDVAIGTHHVCAIVKGGKVYCWGDNSQGQLGARRTEPRIDSPVQVEGIEGATQIVAGMMHSCVLLAEGRVSCWGWNGNGQTGSDIEYGSEARELVTPEMVPGISGATRIAASRDQTCVRMNDASWCWGRSYTKSQLDTRGYHHNQPARVQEIADLQQFGFSGETACGLFQDAHVGCWGSGAFSILPTRPLQADTPLPVILPPARSLAVSKYHGCAILQNGKVSCWGWNNHGELGRDPQPDYSSHESEIVEGLPGNAQSLALGSATSCAILRNDELWCWGIAPQNPYVHNAGSGKPARVPIQ